MRPSSRLDRLPPYLFAELERKISEKKAAGVDVISLGIGDPDTPTPGPVIEALAEAARDPSTHRYPSNRGRPELREAFARFYERRFGVTLDPDAEIIPALGAKECVFNLNLAFLDPDSIALAADPGYPVYTGGPLLAGEHDVLIVHDASYTETTYDGYVAPSFLATPGAKDVGVEVFSLSKGWNMTGWRTAAVVGNADAVSAYWRLKTNIDSGMFEALQLATAAALDAGPPPEMSAIYQRRRDLVCDALREIGVDVEP